MLRRIGMSQLAAVVLVALALTPHAADSAECAATEWAGQRYTECRAIYPRDAVALFWGGSNGKALGSFAALRRNLGGHRQQLVFAMNAGMYHADLRPVGLLVVAGREIAPLNLASGRGNFFVQPNGVYAITATGPAVITSGVYAATRPLVTHATQSGPMLVVNGEIPTSAVFRRGSGSRHVRNGVCVRNGTDSHFVISEGPVTFFEFASYFRDRLACRDALYLDGAISSLYAPNLGSRDSHTALGPMIAVTLPGVP
jgi:uncharacterized protein YigE (DUF2233 family)